VAQAYFLFKAPSKYLGLLRKIIGQPAPYPSFLVKRIIIFLKGVWLARRLEHMPVQLVHTHFAWLPAIAGIVVSQLLDIPFTVTAHAYDIYSQKNDLLALATNMADHIITISETNKKAVCKMNPQMNSEKVAVIRCGIDLNYFRPDGRELARKTIQITSVGSLLGKKGHEYLIRACAILQAQHLDFQCMIVGRGELEQHLQNLIQELGLENRVQLAGAQTQEWVRDRLCKSDLFVLACVDAGGGNRDGIPVALMEAMAMSVPVISTPISGIPELVRNEETGLLVPERDAQAIAEAIVRLVSDTFLRQLVIKNGLDLTHKEYDIDKNTDRLSTLFEHVIKERH
jgi:glycosyltransferase involved in cell wall biosynthesis